MDRRPPAAALAPVAPVVPGDVGTEAGEVVPWASDLVECPECAEPIRARARSCRFCGFDLEAGARRGGRVEVLSRPRDRAPAVQHIVHHVPKSPGVAVVLSFLFTGLGQLYCGRIGKGLAFMVAPLVVFALWALGVLGFKTRVNPETGAQTFALGTLGVALLACLLLWVWQLYDAYQTALEMNRATWRRGSRRGR